MPKKSTTESSETDPLETESLASTDEADAAQSYEQARDELAAVVTKLEAGGITLEESLKLWERGERLATVCQEWLDGARKRLATITSRRSEEA